MTCDWAPRRGCDPMRRARMDSSHLNICDFSERYRGTSLKRSSAPLGPYSRNMPRALWWSQRGLFLMSEVPL